MLAASNAISVPRAMKASGKKLLASCTMRAVQESGRSSERPLLFYFEGMGRPQAKRRLNAPRQARAVPMSITVAPPSGTCAPLGAIQPLP
jgi:hypothetical protein